MDSLLLWDVFISLSMAPKRRVTMKACRTKKIPPSIHLLQTTSVRRIPPLTSTSPHLLYWLKQKSRTGERATDPLNPLFYSKCHGSWCSALQGASNTFQSPISKLSCLLMWPLISWYISSGGTNLSTLIGLSECSESLRQGGCSPRSQNRPRMRMSWLGGQLVKAC